MRKFMYSYNNNSESGIKLKNALGIRLISHNNSLFKGDNKTLVFNWGCSDLPREVRKCEVINNENAVALAVNKLRALEAMVDSDVNCVPFTTNRQVVIDALRNRNEVVYCRTHLTGHDGAGIVVVRNGDMVPEAKLYTFKVHSENEYRITVCNGRVVCRQRKVRLDTRPATGYNDEIKTTGGGYGFKWVTRGIPPAVEEEALKAIDALELHYGGVDVIWEGRSAFVLEVNTAPQLTDLACQALANALIEDYGLNEEV